MSISISPNYLCDLSRHNKPHVHVMCFEVHRGACGVNFYKVQRESSLFGRKAGEYVPTSGIEYRTYGKLRARIHKGYS